MNKLKLSAIFLALIITLTACVSREGSSSSENESSSSSLPESSSSSSLPTSSQPDKETEIAVPEMPMDKELTPPDLNKISTLSPSNIPWGPGVQKNDDNRPIACVDLQEKYAKYDAHFIAPMEKKIFLTFDEGYENGNSAAILDVLKEKNVSAVFFVTKEYAKGNHELIQRMIDEGHIVGNHSSGHPNYTKVSLEDAQKATTDLHQYMLDEFDYKMTLFRFPEGAFSEQSLALVQALGYQTSFWSFAYKDWDPKEQMDKTAAFDKITKNTHDGAIYLLHAVSATNADILGDVIDYWRDNSYEVAKYNIDYKDKVDAPICLPDGDSSDVSATSKSTSSSENSNSSSSK